MAWTGHWSIKVDGTEINDLTTYVTQVPELDDVAPQRIILAQIDGDYPVFIRSQPAEMPLTFLIAMNHVSSDTDYQTRKAFLKAMFSQGVYHTLLAQVRGMASAQSLRFIVESGKPDYRTKTFVVNCVVPKPVLA